MDALLEQARDIWEGQIDFEGQRLADFLSTAMLTTFGIVSFLLGWLTNNITYTLWAGIAGAALTFVVVVPPWPYYNKHPLNWLPSTKAASSGPTAFNIVVDGTKTQ